MQILSHDTNITNLTKKFLKMQVQDKKKSSKNVLTSKKIDKKSKFSNKKKKRKKKNNKNLSSPEDNEDIISDDEDDDNFHSLDSDNDVMVVKKSPKKSITNLPSKSIKRRRLNSHKNSQLASPLHTIIQFFLV